MSAKRFLKRVLTVMVMTVCIFILLTVMRAEAMPIRPDVRKVLAQPRVSPAQFAPARAGWDGPESARPTQTLNTTFDQLGPGGTVRAVKESLLSAALPDYRALAAIALIILLLRRMRKDRRSAELAAAAAPAIVVQVSDPAAEPKIERAA